ncbi:MAG: hypothetical protein V7K89_09450 [Nostoc sp.]|uniref:hypothetical protein n=1 Tax=Nostoc sp. TaxID=1180 RepID=UPI002FF82589
MRDPFPLERATAPNGEEIGLWIIDLERLSSLQFNCLAQVIAIESKASPTDVASDARANGGFATSISRSSAWSLNSRHWSMMSSSKPTTRFLTGLILV